MTYLGHGQCFVCEFLVVSFLVFSFYKNLKYYHHLCFIAVFPELKMIKFWSVNYVCHFCKLYFYFGYVQNFGQYLYFSVFSKH